MAKADSTWGNISIPLDVVDRFDRSIKAAGSLCQVTYGEQGETFRCLNDEIQDNIMAILSEKIDSISEIWQEVKSALIAQKEAA